MKDLAMNLFVAKSEECLADNPDGVIGAVPAELDITRQFTDKLHESNTPFIMLDSYMPDLLPLSFYGQDSLQ